MYLNKDYTYTYLKKNPIYTNIINITDTMNNIINKCNEKINYNKNNNEGFEGGIRKHNAWIIYLTLVIICFVVCIIQ
jgi:hypothetical protein